MRKLSKLSRSISGKVVLITGATSGMGSATAKLFSDVGAKVVVTDLDDKKIKLSGSENNTTNNRMELKAVIYALDYLNEKRDIIIFTDSKYVMQGIQEWIKKWKTNDWKTAQKKDVKNKDLWVELDNSCKKHKVNWKWVKAHAGNKYNNLVDELAVSETK